ncbi:MAG TPA: segregation/condensation protein A [Candidatus Omnitrophota bacterium]|nr:segregation/condensation protein A [Candidatus Omnitrophota bacterium]
MGYKLRLDIFEGPLDLLLFLIKKNDIDITDIPIAKITEQYMEYIEMMKMLDLDMVGDFLVMAATLMQIKSKMLLPPDPTEAEQEEEDPRDDLVRRLQEYKKFKEIADELKEKELRQRDFFARVPDEETKSQLIEDAKEVFFEASLFDLINALSDALRKVPEEVIHKITVEEFTVEQKIHDVLHCLLQETRISLRDLFRRARTKEEMVVTFLAILELVRLKEIKAVQKRLFEDIEILRNTDNMVPPDPQKTDGSPAKE